MGFSTIGIETMRESFLLQIKNKELGVLWMSMQNMCNLHTRSTISLTQYDHLSCTVYNGENTTKNDKTIPN